MKLGKFFISDHFSAAMAIRNNFSVALLLSLHFISLSFGADNISAGHSLSGDQTIVSSGGNFELGFFKPGSPSNYYIGIWYKKVSTSTPTVVWVANRDQPISDKFSSELKIVGRNLLLLDESKTPIWSTEVHQQDMISDSAVAVLLDDGNLVLRDGSKSDQVLDIWQSFDHPTDTWLPGGKIGYNNRTKTKHILFSWKNREDPAKGLFSIELDPTEKQYIIRWNRSKDYWTSRPWNGKIFSLVPEMQVNDRIFYFSYVENENESYFTYSAYNPSFISRFVVDISGQVKQLTWLEKTGQWYLFWSQPIQHCQVYGLCGAFGTCSENSLSFCNCLPGFIPRSKNDWNLSDYSGGCMRKTDLHCGDKHGFFKSTGMVLPKDYESLNVGSEEECKSICSRNCSCVAYAYESNVRCSIWNEQLFNLNLVPQDQGNGKTIYIKLASPDLSRERNNLLHIIVVAVSVTSGILVLFAVILLIVRIQRRSVQKMKMVDGLLTAFPYRDLQIATNNFSHRLGGGGFGSVFKGMLPDATVVAVKKLQSVSQGEKQFRNEVSTIGMIQHVNLVQLRGFCSHGNEKLLVYDYMPNGSLDLHLFHEKKDKVLDWKTRYQIALGTARGLVYLHEKCRDCIIHCDIKPENILLDSQLRPKVADFGLAKLVGRDFSRVLTTMRGTRGYLAPEWLSGIAITPKADVYSYGMMLFELVSGRRNMKQYEDGSSNFFPTWAASVTIQGGDMLDLLDPRLNRIASVEEVTRMCRLACWCIQDGEENRPSMSLVVQILEGVSDVNPNPQLPRCLQLLLHNSEPTFLFTESYSSQSTQVDGNTSSSCS